MSLSPPVKITVPFATGGLKNAIPANANPTDGHAGYDVGFPAINMTPKIAGGIPPFGQDFNGIFFEVSTAIQFLEAGGSFPFDSAFATAVGGYPIGAVVSRTDSTGLWRNTVANNTTDPEAFGAGWQPEDAGGTSIAMSSANVTLTALQAARSIIVITGALTASLNLVLPSYAKQWLIVNKCTGAFTVTVKTSAGSGVVTNIGTVQTVFGDGTNIVGASIPAVGVVGAATGVRMSVLTPSASVVIFATSLIVAQSLIGNKYLVSNLSLGINLAAVGAGGMDTGAAPNNGYVAVYAIYNPLNGVVNTLSVNATSAAAPEVYGGSSMPAGFTASALLTVVPTNASGQFKICVVRGRSITLQLTSIYTATSTLVTTNVNVSAAVPPNAIKIGGEISFQSSSTSSMALNIYSDAATLAGQQALSGALAVGGSLTGNYSGVMFITPQFLAVSSTATGAGPTFTIYAGGYEI